MASKESKAIKQVKKQIKKLNTRINDMSGEIKALQDIANNTVTEQLAGELQEGAAQVAVPVSKFSQEEVESADEMTEFAEEIADMKEKKKKRKKK